MNVFDLQRIIETRDISEFSQEILGITVHEGQDFWFNNSNKQVNILKPGNQWGKTTAEAIKHIYHAVCKPKLDRFGMTHQDRFDFKYRTLNFGKTYEVANGVPEALIEIVEGRYLLPDGTYNESLLAGFAIQKISTPPKLPVIKWWNNSETLIRSYDGLGESFKRLRLAFISGDECGDIPELTLFLNGTLMPRTFFFQGEIDLVGTAQPKGIEYEELSEQAEEDMKEFGEYSDYFILSFNSFPQYSSVYTNEYMPAESIKKIEGIADPQLRDQIIYGKYTEFGKRLYTFEEVSQMFKNDLPYDPETGFTEEPERNAFYIFSVDMAASEDETSCTCIRYNRKLHTRDGRKVPLKHRVVFHKAWKGSSMPLDLQYQTILSHYKSFRKVSPKRTKFVYDAGSLGGKNAGNAFKSVNPYPFPPKKRRYSEVKAEGQIKVKEILGLNRKQEIGEDGKKVDVDDNWGGVEASPHIKELRRQLEIASKKDDKIKNDQYTSFMQAIHFIETRVPKSGNSNKAQDFNIMRG